MRPEQYDLEGDFRHEQLRLMIPAVFAVLMMATPSKPVQATCKSWVSGNAEALAHQVANVKARSDWAAKVTGIYGPGWASFAQAQVGASPCNKVSTATWSCTVRAKPCMADLKTAR
jgi:hypothetical protein